MQKTSVLIFFLEPPESILFVGERSCFRLKPGYEPLQDSFNGSDRLVIGDMSVDCEVVLLAVFGYDKRRK